MSEQEKHNRFGEAEKRHLVEAIDTGNLFYVNGVKTTAFCERVAALNGVPYCATTSSGTGALHAAIGALELPPGTEVITAPITDMGTVIGVLYQNLIPVFADVDPHTYNVTADTIAARITDRTGAIIVVHLAGNPADMDEILAVAEAHHLPVIEDCAQAHGARYKNHPVGTMGALGCFSLNNFKHINSGDGGFVITRDEDLYRRVHNFADKSYDRLGSVGRLSTLAPCYRITELQSAVALAQLDKVERITRARHDHGTAFNEGLAGLDGVTAHHVPASNYCTFWFAMIRVDPAVLGCSRDQFATVLKFEQVPASGGYIAKPLYLEPLFREKQFFPGGVWPAEVVAGREVTYEPGLCPVAEEVLATAIRVSITEFQTEAEVARMVAGVRRAHAAAVAGEL